MVFRRRKQLGFWQRARGWVYPQGGWRRGLEYLGHRIKRLPDSPHRISLGICCGVMASFTPFFAFHFVIAGLLAYLVRGNILASLIATLFGNPLTFPLIAATSLNTGAWILGRNKVDGAADRFKTELLDAVNGLWQSTKSLFGYGPSAWDKLAGFWDSFFLPYLVGGVGPGLITAVIVYFITKPLIATYQARRRLRILATAKIKAAGKAPA